MCIHVKNIPAKFHPDLIWSNRALGFFEEVASNLKKKYKNNKTITEY